MNMGPAQYSPIQPRTMGRSSPGWVLGPGWTGAGSRRTRATEAGRPRRFQTLCGQHLAWGRGGDIDLNKMAFDIRFFHNLYMHIVFISHKEILLESMLKQVYIMKRVKCMWVFFSHLTQGANISSYNKSISSQRLRHTLLL